MTDLLEEPYTIASLPRPLDSTSGSIVAAAVYGLGDSKKRKRHEVAVGVDGEGVHIYNVQKHNLITSYALSPQSHLIAKPLSIYRKRAKGFPAQRHTFVPAKSDNHSGDGELLCFTEDAQRPESKAYGAKAAVKTSIRLDQKTVQSMEIVPISSDAESAVSAFDVLLVYSNGRVQCVAGDLSCERWLDAAAFVGDDGTNMRIEYAAVVDLDSAKKGLLSSREDVVAVLDAESQGSSASLLCTICRLRPDEKTRTLRLCAIRGRSVDAVFSRRPGLHEVLAYDLPYDPSWTFDGDSAQFSLHAASGTLQELRKDSLLTHDLSGTTPRTTSILSLDGNGGFYRFLRLSSTTVLAVSTDTTTVYETRYGAVLSSRQHEPTTNTELLGQKRKRNQTDEDYVPFDLVSYLSDLDLIVAVRPGELVAFHCRSVKRPSKHLMTNGPRLIDVMGKGSITARSPNGESPASPDESVEVWQKWKTRVDDIVEKHDTEGLEDFVAQDFEGLHDHERQLVSLDATTVRRGIDRRKAAYLLSKIFEPLPDETVLPTIQATQGRQRPGRARQSTTPGASIALRLNSHLILNSLALAEFLTASALEREFQRSVKPGDIMTALRDKDPSFDTIRDLLAYNARLEVADVVQALKLIVQSFDTPAAADLPRTLQLTAALTSGDSPKTNGDINYLDEDVERASEAAELELNAANSTLDHGLQIRSACLRSIFARLQSFPSTLVTSTLRSMMAQRELVFSIHLLRIELADGGWTSRYVDAGEDEEEELAQRALARIENGDADKEGSSDHALTAIGILLNCTVDAVGTSGWLVGLSSDVLGTDEILSSLGVEISAALEGCHEASALAMFLDEFERYGSQVQKTSRHRKRKELDQMLADGRVDAILPIGCKVDAPVSRERDSKDGRKGKKSQREIGRELSMRVGKYTVDRIRV